MILEIVQSARKVCRSVRLGGGNPKTVWWDDQVETAVKRKENSWKVVLGAKDEDAQERCLKAYKEKKIKVKRFIYQSKKEVHEQFGNRKLFWKEASIANGGKVENCSRIKDGNRRFTL